MNDVLQAIQVRRSVRRFASEPITREHVEAILGGAMGSVRKEHAAVALRGGGEP